MSFTENTKDDNCRILTVIFFYLEFLFLLVFSFSFLLLFYLMFIMFIKVHKIKISLKTLIFCVKVELFKKLVFLSVKKTSKLNISRLKRAMALKMKNHVVSPITSYHSGTPNQSWILNQKNNNIRETSAYFVIF